MSQGSPRFPITKNNKKKEKKSGNSVLKQANVRFVIQMMYFL